MKNRDKIKEFAIRRIPQKEIAKQVGVSLALVKKYASEDAHEIAIARGEVSEKNVIQKHDWYKTNSGMFARVLGFGLGKLVTVSIHQSIVSARERLDGSNQADFNYDFIFKNWKKISAIKN